MISDSLKKGRAGAAALRLRISPATGARWGLAIRRMGQARTAPQGRPHGKSKLDPHRAFLIELIDQDGDMTVPELAGALEDVISVQAHPDAICRFLRKLGFTSLKKTLIATERRRARGRKQRDNWVKHCLPAVAARPDRVVFIPSHRCKQRLPGSGRNLRQSQPDPPAGLVTTGRAAGDGRALWIMENADLHHRPHRRCVDRSLGHQGRGDGPLPVCQGPPAQDRLPFLILNR